MKVFTSEELHDAVMNWPTGCPEGKKQFLLNHLGIKPKPNLATITFTVTMEVPEDSVTLSARGLGRVIQNGFFYERRDKDMWAEHSWPLDGGNIRVEQTGDVPHYISEPYVRELDANRSH